MKVVNVTTGEEVQPKIVERAPCDCLQDEITGLAGDVLSLGIDVDEHEDVLQMLGEKLQAIEDEQVKDMENLSSTIDVLGCLQKANRMMLDVIMEQDREIKELRGEFRILNNAWFRWLMVTLIWLLVLTGRMCYNVFF